MRRLKSLKHAEDEDGGYKHLLSGQQNSGGCTAAEQHPNINAHTEAHAAPELLTAKCGKFACCCARTLWDSGLTCSLLASLIFSFSGLFVKLTGGRVPVLEVCLIRSSISFGLTLILMKGANMSPIFGQQSNLRLLCARGCCGACSMTTWYIGLFLLPLGDAVTISLIGPAVTAVVARVFLKEPLGYRGAFGCFVSMAGVVVLSRPPFLFGGNKEWSRTQTIGTAALILSAVLGSGSSLTIRLIGKKEPAAVIAMWFHTCTMILSSIPLAFGFPNKFALLSGKDFSLLLGVAGTSFVAQLLSTRGLQMVMAAKAAAMGFTQVFYSYILGAMFFGERVSLMGLAGVVLILVGVLMVTMRSPSQGPDTSKLQPAAAEAEASGLLVASRMHSINCGDPRQAAGIAPSRANSLFAAAVTAKAKAALEDETNEEQMLLKASSVSAAVDELLRQPSAVAGRLDALTADVAVLIKTTSTAASAVTSPEETEGAAARGDTERDTETGVPLHNALAKVTTLQIRRPGGLSSAFRQAAVQAEGHAGGLVAIELQKQLAQTAAEAAAAALGGELCPASTASLAHSVSHMSRNTSLNAVLCISLQKSTHLAQLDSTGTVGRANGARSAAMTPEPDAAVAEAGEQDKPPLPPVFTLSPAQPIAVPDGRRVTAAEGLFSAPNATRQLTKQLTSFLAASLLAVSPEMGSLSQQGRLQESLLDSSLMSPDLSPQRCGEQQQLAEQMQQQDSGEQPLPQQRSKKEMSPSGQLTEPVHSANGTLLLAATEVTAGAATESAVVHNSSRVEHSVRASSTL